MKRILCIEDLSTVGRSSLAVVSPVLSVMGSQCCPLPGALLSSHTGGFDPVTKLDTTGFVADALAAYRAQDIDFDCILTGYLSSPQQALLLADELPHHAAALKVTDPAMADNGQLYHGFGPEMVDAMRTLCAKADVLVPNPTEAALLAGEEPLAAYEPQQAEALCGRLAERFGAKVIITGVPLAGGGVVCVGRGEAAWELFSLKCNYVDENYPGTGDLFAAVLTGALLRGNALQSAAELALRFVENAARATYAARHDARFGVEFEPLLSELLPQKEDAQWQR